MVTRLATSGSSFAIDVRRSRQLARNDGSGCARAMLDVPATIEEAKIEPATIKPAGDRERTLAVRFTIAPDSGASARRTRSAVIGSAGRPSANPASRKRCVSGQIICDGKLDDTAMKKGELSHGDLEEALRLHGRAGIEGIKAAYLERNGAISVIKH